MGHSSAIAIAIASVWTCLVAVPASAGPKVTLCHVPPGNPQAAHTIEIAAPAADSHFAHHPGDYPGECVFVDPCDGIEVASHECICAQLPEDAMRYRVEVSPGTTPELTETVVEEREPDGSICLDENVAEVIVLGPCELNPDFPEAAKTFGGDVYECLLLRTRDLACVETFEAVIELADGTTCDAHLVPGCSLQAFTCR